MYGSSVECKKSDNRAGSYLMLCSSANSSSVLPDQMKTMSWATVKQYDTTEKCNRDEAAVGATFYPTGCFKIMNTTFAKFSCGDKQLLQQYYADDKCQIARGSITPLAMLEPNNTLIDCSRKLALTCSSATTTSPTSSITSSPTSNVQTGGVFQVMYSDDNCRGI